MPHFPHTPEALLGRNDSKNPATTCKGITSSGRPCRRALAASRVSSLTRRESSNSALGGVVALVHEDGELHEADFYCWQHKEQAQQRLVEEERAKNDDGKSKRRSTELFPLKEKSSIDTMVQRLGLNATGGEQRQSRTTHPKAPRRTETRDFAQRPSVAPHAEKYNLGPASRRPRSNPRKQGFWTSLCCMAADDDDYLEVVRHKRRVDSNHVAQSAFPDATEASASLLARKPARTVLEPLTGRDNTPTANAQTNHLLSLIPISLSPQTTSALLAELTKPISPHDEDGYIYIFWLTPQSKTAPGDTTARSLLSLPDNQQRPANARRISDVMTEYSFESDDAPPQTASRSHRVTGTKRTIMLKIGRANNITRRMNEWQRQCGYALNLVRWYPYMPSSPQPTPRTSPQREVMYPDLSRPSTGRRESSGVVRKVPCVKRVERLIHLELAEKQVKRQCSTCGKEHREWFDVDASQAGIRAVDEVVKRWVGWADSQS